MLSNNFRFKKFCFAFVFMILSGTYASDNTSQCEIKLEHNFIYHDFDGGDYQDTFISFEHEACPIGKYCSIFSIAENQDDEMPCYIDIEYFNTAKLAFEYNDRVKLTSNSNYTMTEISEKGKWETLFDKFYEQTLGNMSDAYILRNKSGRKASLHVI